MNSLFEFIGYILGVLISLSLLSCVSYEGRSVKKVTALLGCEDPDSYDDLLHSFEGVRSLSERKSIKMVVNVDDERCGYILSWHSEKYIHGVLTDYDLMLELKAFFELD